MCLAVDGDGNFGASHFVMKVETNELLELVQGRDGIGDKVNSSCRGLSGPYCAARHVAAELEMLGTRRSGISQTSVSGETIRCRRTGTVQRDDSMKRD